MKAGPGFPSFRSTGRDQPIRQVAVKFQNANGRHRVPRHPARYANGFQQSLRSERRLLVERVRKKGNGFRSHSASLSQPAHSLKGRRVCKSRHGRDLAPIGQGGIIRPNRDTLYSLCGFRPRRRSGDDCVARSRQAFYDDVGNQRRPLHAAGLLRRGQPHAEPRDDRYPLCLSQFSYCQSASQREPGKG